MGREEVTFQPGVKLARTCDGFAKESVPEVIGSLFVADQRPRSSATPPVSNLSRYAIGSDGGTKMVDHRMVTGN